jgi:hypothetical protein
MAWSDDIVKMTRAAFQDSAKRSYHEIVDRNPLIDLFEKNEKRTSVMRRPRLGKPHIICKKDWWTIHFALSSDLPLFQYWLWQTRRNND